MKIELKKENNEISVSGDWTLQDVLVFELLTKEASQPKMKAFIEKALKLGAYTLSVAEFQVGMQGIVRDLDAKLIHIKHAFDVREIKDQSAGRGEIAEVDIYQHFQEFFENSNDSIERTGASVGSLPRRKVGDYVVILENSARKIAIESKFDKSKVFGNLAAMKEETGLGQVALSSANREAHYSIFVAEEGGSAAKEIKDLKFMPELAAFFVVVNPKTNQYMYLDLALKLAKSLTLAIDLDPVLAQHALLCCKLILLEVTNLKSLDSDLAALDKTSKDLLNTKSSIETKLSASVQRLGQIQEFLSSIEDHNDEQALRVQRLELLMGKTYS